MSKSIQKNFFTISILINLGYYISAYFTHTLDIFFEHVTMGQDFFQIPNAAYAFLHNGALTGALPYDIAPYTECCGVNSNVYHPLFTLIIGIPLQLLSPWTAFGAWGAFHLLITILTVLFLWKKFVNHKYLYLALSFFLLNSYHYYEIQHAQYHFLLNFFIVLFLYVILNNKSKVLGGILYFLTLLIKPIGLLWIIPLLINRHSKVMIVGIFVYAIISAPFAVLPAGRYFFTNLSSVATTPIASYNLLSINNLFSFNLFYIEILTLLVATGLILLNIFKKSNIFISIFLWISFYLIFYSLVFHYHYTILAGLICLGLLENIFSPKRFEIIPIIFLTIPTPIIFFHLSGDPAILPTTHLSIIALWSIFWLLVLDLCLIFRLFKNQTQKINIPNTLPYESVR